MIGVRSFIVTFSVINKDPTPVTLILLYPGEVSEFNMGGLNYDEV